MTKQEAREKMTRMREELSGAERKRKDQEIAKYLLRFLAMQRKSWFLPFVSYGTEADTLQLIKHILADGSFNVAVPKVEGEKMVFYQITSMEDLAPGFHGIPEPVTGKSVSVDEGIMLLPGLAFDRAKNRVGYGGGFYDRYLREHDSGGIITIALAYDFQIVDEIQAESFDRRPQWIVTDRGIF